MADTSRREFLSGAARLAGVSAAAVAAGAPSVFDARCEVKNDPDAPERAALVGQAF